MTSDDITNSINKYFPDPATFELMLQNAALTVQVQQFDIQIAALDKDAVAAQSPIIAKRTELNNQRQAILDTMAALIPQPKG